VDGRVLIENDGPNLVVFLVVTMEVISNAQHHHKSRRDSFSESWPPKSG